MRRKFLRAGRLSFREWGLFIHAWLLLLWVELALRFFSYARVSRWLSHIPNPTKKPQPPNPSANIQTTLQWVDTASRNHILTITCLRRSLVAQNLLAQQGIPVELRFGIKKDNDAFCAHAWLEYQGQAIGEAEQLTQAYQPLAKV